MFLKEVNGKLYGVGSYFLGKTIPELFIQIIGPLLLGSITYWMIGLNDTNATHPLLFLFISIVTSLAGGGMGLALGTLVPDG